MTHKTVSNEKYEVESGRELDVTKGKCQQEVVYAVGADEGQ